jgi:hypothetical protein
LATIDSAILRDASSIISSPGMTATARLDGGRAVVGREDPRGMLEVGPGRCERLVSGVDLVVSG